MKKNKKKQFEEKINEEQTEQVEEVNAETEESVNAETEQGEEIKQEKYSKKENTIRRALISLNLLSKDSDKPTFYNTVKNYLLGLNIKNFSNVEHHYDVLKSSLNLKIKQRKEKKKANQDIG